MAGKINVPITTAIQGIANAQRQLGQLSKGIQTVGRTAGLAAIGFAAFTTGLKAADFAVNAIAGARDLERNMLGLKTVFDDVTPQMVEFSRKAEAVGLSLNEASKASVFIGSVLKQSGFSIQETADLTERLVRLGTDLSLTYGYDVQEALMGMTALFRGEYDPIEKFGVAMKQSEINSELAARGLNNLEGAQRRFAEQQIRVELLFQRSQDAQGAFERGAGTLAVEQLRLQAMFNNLRDTVANNLLPAMGLLTQSFREALEGVEPKIKESFEALEPVLYDLGNVLIPALANGLALVVDGFNAFLRAIRPLFDPTSQLGGAIAGLVFQLDSLFTTLSNTAPTADQTRGFQFLVNVVSDLVGLLGRVIYWIDVLATKKRIWEEFFAAIFQGDWDTLFQDWDAYTNTQIKNIDLTKEQKIAQYEYNYQLQQTELLVRNAARANLEATAIADRAERNRFNNIKAQIKEIETGGGGGGGGTGGGAKAAKNYVKEFTDKLAEEIKKQTVREQLKLEGASEGLIDSILGSEGWESVWKQIGAGKLVLKDLQDQFYKTAAGAAELKKAAADLKAWEDAVKAIDDQLTKDLQDIADKAAEVKRSFADLLNGFVVLPTIQRTIGEFEQQVTSHLESIEASLRSAFDNKDIFEAGYKELQAFARKELEALRKIGQQRDELAERFNLADGLIKNYREAFTAALNLTTLFGQLKDETETRTVTSVSRALMRLGGSMREFEVTISSTYEETIGGIQSKSQGVLEGFRAMAQKAREFADNLRKLRELGLDSQLFNQLVEAGVEAGGETAKALVEGGKTTIDELNDLFKEIDAVGGNLGQEMAAELYSTGIDMANGLLEGIRSKQAELENQARNMAQAFNDAFQASLKVEVGIAQKAAEDAARAAADAAKAELGPKPVLPVISEDPAMKQIQSLIDGANRYIKNITDPLKATGASQKLNIYESLKADLQAGVPLNLSGIQSGLSRDELIARAKAAGGTVNNYYTVQVTSDSRTSGAKAGEAVVESLQKFGQLNGNFTVGVAG